MVANVSAALKGHDFLRAYVDIVYLYIAASVLYSGPEALTMMFLNIKLMPPFRMPILSQTLGEFWGRRWNLTVHRVMKHTLYEPIIEGTHNRSNFVDFAQGRLLLAQSIERDGEYPRRGRLWAVW